MNYASKQFVRLGLLAACGIALMGCQGVKDAAGLGKQSPDEFAVATKQPLVIPPDFNLRPPRDGAPPTNQVQPTDAAQSALFDDPATAAKRMSGDYSDAERTLLANARATNPDPAIRQRIAADGRAMEASDDSFASQVLFWQDSKSDTGTPVDADAESKRIEAQKAAGAGAATKPAAQKPNDSATIGKSDNDKQESKGGWLDGIF
jgi:hypothetical protein